MDHPAGPLALRLHRHDYRTDEHLAIELDWIAWVAQSGLTVPIPKASINGSFLQVVDGMQVDVLSWVAGDALDAVLPGMGPTAQARVFYVLGRDMAKLYIACDTLAYATFRARPSWDVDGLLGEMPLWDRFWENPGFTAKQCDLFRAFYANARAARRSSYVTGS